MIFHHILDLFLDHFGPIDYPKMSSNEIAEDQKQTDKMVEKIGKLSAERDSAIESTQPLRNKLFQVSYQRDSLREVNLNLERKMNFLEEHIREVQGEIESIKGKSVPDSIKNKIKEPSIPSEFHYFERFAFL